MNNTDDLYSAVSACRLYVVKQQQGEVLHLPVDLRSYSHPWSQDLGSDQKMEIMDTNGRNEFPPPGVWAALETEWEVLSSSILLLI